MVSEKLIFSTKHQAPSTNASAARIKRPGRLLFTYRLPPTAYRLPPTACRLPPTAYRLPPTAYRLPPAAYRLPPTAYRLPPAACRLPPATSHQPPATSHQPPATCRQPPAASHLPPAACHQPPAACHQPPIFFPTRFSPRQAQFPQNCPFSGQMSIFWTLSQNGTCLKTRRLKMGHLGHRKDSFSPVFRSPSYRTPLIVCD